MVASKQRPICLIILRPCSIIFSDDLDPNIVVHMANLATLQLYPSAEELAGGILRDVQYILYRCIIDNVIIFGNLLAFFSFFPFHCRIHARN